MKCFLGNSNFLEERSSISHYIVFLYFFFFSCSLKKAFFFWVGGAGIEFIWRHVQYETSATHWERVHSASGSMSLDYLSCLFFETAFSWVYLPLLPCLSLLFFPQLFIRRLQTTILPSHMSFYSGWFWSLSLVQCYRTLSIVFPALYQI